ncbi:MAG: ABC transporter substrate-binding protein [Saezia sp.]
MQLNRRGFLCVAGALASPALPALGRISGRNNIRLGVTLEPPGLDPTISAASSISEVCLYNLYETLTKITPEGKILPLLAKSWDVSDDARNYTFYLEKNVSFHNGEPFNAQSVEFTLERAGASNSTNKDKAFYANIKHINVLDEHTIHIELESSDADFLFKLGMGTAVMLEPKSIAQNRTNPVGTGPYRLQRWRRGVAIVLERCPQYRHAAQIQLEEATFLFISDPYAQMASLLANDVDVFARVAVARSLPAFERQLSRFQVIVSNSRAKTLLSINNRRVPLNDVRVRRAITAAIDRAVVIESAADGYGLPIGSHYTPDMPGFIDTTGITPYNPELARALLKEAGVSAPLKLNFILPPAPYARQGGEIIAAMLAKVGIELKIQNVEWAQWLSQVYTQHDFDLSMVSHVEPLDLDSYARDSYYWGYQSEAFNALYQQIQSTLPEDARNQLLAQAQEMLAHDTVNVWLYQPRWITVANANLGGLWHDMPIFVNDLSAMRWF